MRGARFAWLWAVLAAGLCAPAGAGDAPSPPEEAPGPREIDPADAAAARRHMVAQVALHARLTAELTGRPELDAAVLDAMLRVPRHAFVRPELARYAYLDVALPAGNGLRESQPFLVALMTDLVAPPRDGDVLILGIGGGYHAAVASALVGRVFCLDLDAEAAAVAMARLAPLDHGKVETRIADPYYGWPEADRRFDAIIVRLAVDEVPAILLSQLKPGGRLVAPVGPSDAEQRLTLFTKDADGRITRRPVLPVRFMRLPGGRRI
jgi:protein-L-isoaspartate(D-aspartate) O-methyltransferase